MVRLHAEDGVDFVTLHCGITRKTIEQISKHKRKMNIVSPGAVQLGLCLDEHDRRGKSLLRAL